MIDLSSNRLPRSPLRTLVVLYRGEYLRLSASLVVFFVKHSPSWAMPLFIANVVDIVADRRHHKLSELWLNAALLVALQLQNVPTHYAYVRLTSASIRRVELAVRAAVCRQMQHLSIGYYSRASAGALQNKAMRDAEVLEQLSRQVFQEVPGILLTILSIAVVVGLRSPWLLVWLVAAVPVAAVLVARARRRIGDRNEEFRLAVEQLSGRVAEMIRMVPVARAHSVEQTSLARVETELERVRSTGLRLDALNGLFSGAAWVVFQVFTSACLVLAGWAAYTHRFGVTVGDVVLVTTYFTTLANNAQALLNQLPLIGKGLESVQSVRELLESPDVERNEGRAEVRSVRGDLRLEHVSYRYDDNDAQSAGVRDIDLEVPAGTAVALVGASGAGKSTMLNLLLGFLRPTGGRILLDGVDMGTLDLRTYRRFVATVPQETLLFNGSLRDNVVYGLPDVSDQRLRGALEAAHVAEFLDELPDGLDTLLGEHGARLSGGQRQRIAIARALVRDPRVLLLDEATSALDPQSEVLVRDALGTLLQGRTSFTVTHRVGSAASAGLIVVLDRGHVIEQGTHDELTQRGGAFSRMSRAALGAGTLPSAS